MKTAFSSGRVDRASAVSPPPHRPQPSLIRTAVGLGLAWGVFCGIANGWPVASTLAQMAVLWVWVAAFAAYRTAPASTTQAAWIGGVTLLAANVAYFAVGLLARSAAGLPLVGGIRFFVLWATVGLATGPVAGALGWWLMSRRRAVAAVAVLAAVSIAEPLALWMHIDHLDAHLAYIGVAAVGSSFSLVWFRQAWRDAFLAVALMLVLIYPMAVALEATLIAFGQISAPMRIV